jgi:hypothetical protein
MWVPGDAREVEEAARRGDLKETPSFDGKLALPSSKRNIDVAIDVAAMSTEGGVLLYGIGEDDDERLTVLKSIVLAGVADRIGQVVSTSIAEVPYIEVSEHPTDADPSKGYVSVLVPQSARAPHQVTVSDDKRFYGRGAKGNRRLSEAEVARLYQRRQDWEKDRDALLSEAIAQAPFSAAEGRGYLHGFARPVAADRAIWERAEGAAGGRQQLQQALVEAAGKPGPNTGYSPTMKRGVNWFRRGADEWLASSSYETDYSRPEKARSTVEARFNIDGRGRFFYGRAADERLGEPEQLLILEGGTAGGYASFLSMVACLYRLGDYYGQVDIGLAVTGLRGGITSSQSHGWSFGFIESDSYEADSFSRTERVASSELLDSESVVRRMLRHLFEATTGRPDYDPFEQ